jgi:hypothetical protein
MIRHAYYERNVITIINEVMIYTLLKILRVKCTSCGSTHAILPGDIIPLLIHFLFLKTQHLLPFESWK